MAVITTLLYTVSENQGGHWIDTNVSVADIETLMFQDVRNGDVYQEIVLSLADIAVYYPGGPDVYTTVYQQNYNFNVRVSGGVLWVSYSSSGSIAYQTKIYKYEIAADTYTVQFASNGGVGAMEDQIINVDEPTALSMCAYTHPDDLSFAGWALSADGVPVYSDGGTVTNLAATGETIALYAVWQAQDGFEIRVQYNASENNRVDKDITNIAVLRGKLRAESSVINPSFIIQGSLAELAGANYLTIPSWHRRYFIRDIVSIRTNLVQISAHVDVRSSWPDQLRECVGIVHRQENDWNLYLNDGTFRTYQTPDVFTQPFPSGFSALSFVLAVAGGSGSSAAAQPEEVEPDGV